MTNPKVFVRGEEKELTWVEKQGDWGPHYELNGDPFDGHRVMWAFSYEPNNYLKESELSGDEWRKGGSIKYFRNGIQVFEEFCREPHQATIQILHMLPKLQDFDWDKLVKGTKLYWCDIPALVDYVMLDQGAFTVIPDGDFVFPDHPWSENWEKLEDPKNVKIDIFDKNIYWYRV